VYHRLSPYSQRQSPCGFYTWSAAVIALHVLGEPRLFEAIQKRDVSSSQPERDRDVSIVRHERDKARSAGTRMPGEEAMSPATHHDDVRQVRLEGVDQPLKVRRDAVA